MDVIFASISLSLSFTDQPTKASSHLQTKLNRAIQWQTGISSNRDINMEHICIWLRLLKSVSASKGFSELIPQLTTSSTRIRPSRLPQACRLFVKSLALIRYGVIRYQIYVINFTPFTE
ncbi:unnamed protein product [Arabis nemorensis]|uniref:Uncharacterized protein n=1 Tax=Arabis nemorensis TaxID=586526 RepID=A0A565BNF5_9BRAS|nr:unnamed protein product [Arabis nemorensis]